MKIAILSDIHSNYHALLACYEDAVRCGAEMFIFLGDYVSDLAEPGKTLDLVYEIRRKYPTVCLRGNREGYMLDCEGGRSSFFRGSKSGSLLFTYGHLRKKDLDFFRGLKISDTIEIEGIQMQLAHAAMEDDRYYFDSSDGRAAEIFPQLKCGYLLTGHSHKQYILRKDGKTIINPGSVGIPQDGTRNPKYAVMDITDGDVSCQLRQVPYDMTAAIRAQFASGLVHDANYWAIGILYDIITGQEWALQLLEAVGKTGSYGDEDAWAAAAQELGMQCAQQQILALYESTRLHDGDGPSRTTAAAR